MTIAAMSFSRYIYVCKSDFYHKVFTKRNSVIICCSLYGVGVILALLNQYGIGDHSFDRKSLECIWDRMASFSYIVVFSVTLVWIPCFIIGVCYLKLYLFVKRHKQKLTNHRNGITTDSFKATATAWKDIYSDLRRVCYLLGALCFTNCSRSRGFLST